MASNPIVVWLVFNENAFMTFPIRFYCLLSAIFILPHVQAQDLEIPVKVIVESSNTNTLSVIKSELQNQLRLKSNVVVKDGDPLYIIVANTAEIIGDDGKVKGISLSTVMTKKIVLSNGTVSYEFLTSIVHSLNTDGIAGICAQLIARFDVKYFDNERKTWTK